MFDAVMNQTFVEVSQSLIEKVRKKYDKTEKSILQDLDILYEWWKKQPHLPYIKDDNLLERLLLRNKFRIEQTKKKIDAYFTLKGMYPEFFSTSWEEMAKSIDIVCNLLYLFPLPKATENGRRILMFKVKDPEKLGKFDFVHFFRYGLLILELLAKYDYCDELHVFGDMHNFGFPIYKRMDPIVMLKGMKLAQEGFSFRMVGIENVNAPSIMELIARILRPLIKDGKLEVHKNYDTVFRKIPKEIMPTEYGGNVGKMDELQDAFNQELYKQKNFLSERISYKSDESKRIGQNPYSDMFGADGTFKKLNLD